MIKAVVFDADNTLYNTGSVTKGADRAALRFFAKQSVSEKRLLRQLQKIIGKVKNSKNPKVRFRNYSYKILAKRFGLKGYSKAYKIFFGETLKRIKAEPSIKQLLPILKRKYKLAIFTEDPRKETIAKLKRTRLKKYFKIIISNNETGVMKPDRRYYRLILKMVKLKPEETLLVGDSYSKDLLPAKKLGFTTVLYKDRNKADYCIRNHNELLRIIKNIK